MNGIYDSIGKTYSVTRHADPRISARLVELLNLPRGASVVDIGAGTGNYSQALAEHGYHVTAVEPSEIMRAQARQHPNLVWREGIGEDLPFGDGEFDGAVMTLCIHHFKDWRKGITEARRVIGDGPHVIFLFDPTRKIYFWLNDYFPEQVEIDVDYGFTLEEICEFAKSLQLQCETIPFPLPRDLKDHFLASGWARPEIYLDEKYRNGISSFSRIGNEAVCSGLEKLRADLDSGHWHDRFGQLLDLEELDLGYLFMKMQPLIAGG